MLTTVLSESWITIVQLAITILGVVYTLRALSKTPGRYAAYGIGALMVVYGLLKLAGLSILARLLEQIFQVGVIVLIVLFRDEARLMLSHLGKRARHVFLATSEEGTRAATRAVEEIAAAAERLATTGYGALIVIEGEDDLQEVAATGIAIDSSLSAPLLEAIFTSTSPLHDGAVIVRDKRIVAAGAVLPLFRGDLAELRRSGTRHRAAFGLASTTDAAVVIVSEERGSIRVARAGKFIPVDREHVRRELLSILTNDDEPEAETRHGRVSAALAKSAVGIMTAYDGMLALVRRRGRTESDEITSPEPLVEQPAADAR